MKSVYRSILLSAIDRYGSLLFFVVSTAILARLLTPAEFGIYAVANALTTIVSTSFQEFGGSNYLLQKPSLSEQSIRTAFTVIFGISAVFTATIFLLRGEVASFFSQDGLQTALAVSCFNFLLSPFSLTIAALLRRDLSFGALTRSNLVGSFTTAATSIGLAARGYSFMAPVIGIIAGNIATTTSLLLTRGDMRIFRPSLSGFRDVLHFGAYSSAGALINVVYNLSPSLILARVLDFTSVGIYSRAVSMTQVFDRLILQVTTPVVGPAIFAHARAGGDLRRPFLRTIELITALQWPFLAFLALLAGPIILVWLGPSWTDVAPLIRLLCIASMALFSATLIYPTLVAVGRIKDGLLASVISLPPSLLVVFIASFHGVNAVAASTLLTFPFQAAVANYLVARQIGLKPWDFARALWKSAAVTICSTVAAAGGMALAEAGHCTAPVVVGISAALCAVAWIASLLVSRHPLLEHTKSLTNALRPASRAAHNPLT
ncbi:oligosaccharide flippase family protein [Bradyrhizobium genosp. L]|uniref:oligosaccharide flippase family protein n=1 Tax=Bradyrhizobium genosp. L TaxID=83637 RepID=UPI0018A30924|nr:oligosaccharide flippase family protein [Bradyrhizobium genosp. L]QPF86540.1 oligosaccharide flippase family protein [Bradyrhizobium genosp. L]